MGLTCLMCGNFGFTNAFVHCVRCLDFVVHRYCLDVIPETIGEYVHWLCDDCDLKVQHKRDTQCQNAKLKASENCKGLTAVDHVDYAELSNKCFPQENEKEYTNRDTPCQKTKLKALENGKGLDHVDSAELSNKRSSQEIEKENTKDNQSEHPSLLDKKQNAKEKKRSMAEPTVEEEQTISCNNSSKKLRKECTNIETMKPAKSGNDSVLPKEKEEKKRYEKSLSEQPCESNSNPGTGNNIKEEGITASFGFDNQGFEMNCEARIITPTNNQNVFAKDPSMPQYLDPNAPTEPQINPIWRGCFEILNPNQHRLEGLMAHLSSKACDKVYDVACQFQTVLQLEMLPKLDVWPKSFHTSQPSDDNIALYIFPSKTSEREFDNLVLKMIEKEFAMRGHMQNAELLLFPSTELPILHWRVQDKYYLWGVFKGKQRAPSQTNPSNKEPEFKNAKNENALKGVKSPVDKKGIKTFADAVYHVELEDERLGTAKPVSDVFIVDDSFNKNKCKWNWKKNKEKGIGEPSKKKKKGNNNKKNVVKKVKEVRKVKCYNCRNCGHYARECPEPQKSKGSQAM